jgi:hypothetical protein
MIRIALEATVATWYHLGNRMNRLRTDFLLSRMTWLTGAGTIFALWGNNYQFNQSQTENEADARALFSDWSNVGADIQTAIGKYQQGEPRQLELNLPTK